MNIRAATAADLPVLNPIAYAARAHRRYSARQLRRWRHELDVEPESLARRPVFVATEHGQAMGFIQVASDTTSWEISGLWELPSHIGQ